jgi:hypothetical protein
MTHGEMSSNEKRIRRLEEDNARLRQALASVKHQVGQVAEDSPRQFQEDGNRPVFIRGQAVGTISASTGNTLGTGTARMLQTIGGSRFQYVPDVQVHVSNDTGGSLPNNTYLWLTGVDGLWSVALADCITANPTTAPLPP